MLKALVIFIFILIPLHLYSLKTVKRGNLLIFYNDNDLKVKAYYIRGNKVESIYRFYYNLHNLCVRKERWEKSRLISYQVFEYYNNKKMKIMKYFYKHRLKAYIKFDQDGSVVEKKIFYDKNNKSTNDKKAKNSTEDKKSSTSQQLKKPTKTENASKKEELGKASNNLNDNANKSKSSSE